MLKSVITSFFNITAKGNAISFKSADINYSFYSFFIKNSNYKYHTDGLIFTVYFDQPTSVQEFLDIKGVLSFFENSNVFKAFVLKLYNACHE